MNDLRAITYAHYGYHHEVAYFYRTDSKKRHAVKGPSKNRLMSAVKRYIKAGYTLCPTFTGWTLVVRR